MISLLKVINLHKSFGKVKALKGISFEVQPATVHGFLGPNGAGKTTTMKILSGLISFDEGSILFENLNYKTNKNAIVKQIGFLPQNPVFYGYLTPVEYLNLIGQICNFESRTIQKRTEEVLEIVKLSNVSKRKISTFSGGMLQRLGIAVAIFNKPKLLLLDEPTASLDPEGRAEVLEHIKSLKEEGITVFFSTHILNDVERICDYVTILHEGKVIVSSSLENLQKRYIQPIFCVEFESIPENFKDRLSKVSYIQKIDIDNYGKVSIFVNNIEYAKIDLIKILSQFETPILSFYLRKPSLEDIFIKVVDKSDI
ncbi:ABC-2 type transport system ATP-binding protein [Caldicellulosiruptor bescii]|uniref:ABC transporter related n=2 Tax=Caldicellulosiruptor bescii TaxID=31899 RepID=B9MKE2_CALBD|nr:ABC transporter ATP-binding protein [Caldicellulosiruptor bescii]ACM60800.1 ABC transporter related [Caldicellulosiruptor bescii DSM 6725]PBC89384.1 ABC-2 type transport system ATP-binding protein [Caldicellulosiruptor bescii]PBC91131.1 ABC-2 type transport system ATP-binding protein [Caldicellulosiruptor bescii]PBD03455.1 ABC-2 type transport system ATP-binding protein [Caldicellulosiruptor bescii]PBD06930.1 ABC-2 type transport system ATP-binding protein [Caldicellulosiruptor bescii]